jgi:hypothetical protein
MLPTTMAVSAMRDIFWSFEAIRTAPCELSTPRWPAAGGRRPAAGGI